MARCFHSTGTSWHQMGGWQVKTKQKKKVFSKWHRGPLEAPHSIALRALNVYPALKEKRAHPHKINPLGVVTHLAREVPEPKTGMGCGAGKGNHCPRSALLWGLARGDHSCAHPNQVISWSEVEERLHWDTGNVARCSRQGLSSLNVPVLKQPKKMTWKMGSGKLCWAQPGGQARCCKAGLRPASEQPHASPHTAPHWLHFQLRIQRKNTIKCLDSGFHFPLLSNQRLINSQCPCEVNISVSCINTYILCLIFP